MNKSVEPTYDDEGLFAPETAAAESPSYYENDEPVYASQVTNAAFYGVYAAEIAAATAYYLRRREKT